VLRVVILSVFLSLCSPAWASPTAEVVETWSGDLADYECGWPGDQIALVVREGAQVMASLDTCSSNAFAKVDVAVSAANTYVLLHTRDGHGLPYLAVYADYLSVYQLADGALVLCNRFLIGDAAGWASRWRYAYVAAPSTGGGIRIVLTLHVDMSEGNTNFDPELVPRERRRVIEVGANCAGAIS
jgi:hypothetical protein